MSIRDLLTDVFEVSPATAAKYESIPETTFYDRFSQLEHVIGFDGATHVLMEGDFLKYCANGFKEYIEAVRIARGKISHTLRVDDYSLFSSMESLESFLRDAEEEKIEVPKGFNLSKFKLFHRDNPQSMEYLTALIDQGRLRVGDHEHWKKSKKDNGPRAGNILKNIIFELRIIYDSLRLPPPNINANFGCNELILPDETRESLRLIRDKFREIQEN